MEERNLDALIITAGEGYSAQIDYLTGGITITGGMVLKKRGEAPRVIAGPMETAEAGATGLEVATLYALGYSDVLALHGNDEHRTQAAMWARALEWIGVTEGRVGLYGSVPIGHYMEMLPRIRELNPQYTFVGELAGATIFDAAYVTRDADELRRIQSVARRTSEVVNATREFLSTHRASDDEIVIKEDGSPLTIGDVKRFVRHQLLDRDLEEEHMIFAQGRDAGFPHSRGSESEALRLGESIVFDLFPRETGGGYFHDMTRTWSLGYASDQVLETYGQVMTAFDMALEAFGVGRGTFAPQEAVLDFFEERGHQTLRTHPGTQQGYVHSLGHGVGLNIHEKPGMRHQVRNEVFQVGTVVTIEPGLYYPEKGYGVRVEDTFYVSERGDLISLTDVPKDLIVPLRGR
jgi:Xaa-Pro aminopeptidase